MENVVRTLNNLQLVRGLKYYTSVEMLENMNKLNLIRNANISSNYATELVLSMYIRTNKDLNRFVKEYGASRELDITEFFAEFDKVRAQKDGEKNSSNLQFNPDYYDVINNILRCKGNIIESVKRSITMPTMADYLEVAQKENAMAKSANVGLDDQINNVQDITGNTLPQHAKFIKDNYKEQSIKVKKGFKINLVMVKADRLTNSQVKLLRKFKNVKTKATARVMNKRGGKGYLSSPTREKQVTLFALNKRFLGNDKNKAPKNLSFNEVLFYSIYDLNTRALKYKKPYIATRLAEATGSVAKEEDVKSVVNATRYLATRYMLFGLNLNNGTDFDPNVVFDYRAEKFFINELNKISDKNNNYILPVVQELASNMAVEFFRNAEISPDLLKQNLKGASKYLPEFDRQYDSNSYTGVLFNSVVSTYNQGKMNKLVKKTEKAPKESAFSKLKGKVSEKIKSKLAFRNKTANVTNAPVQEKIQKEEHIDTNATAKKEVEIQGARTIKYKIFGQEKEFPIYTYEQYCENYVKNILKPCSEKDGLVSAKEAYEQYNAIDDPNLSTQQKLEQVMGADMLRKFYNKYVVYSDMEANKRSACCEGLVSNIVETLDKKITTLSATYVSMQDDLKKDGEIEEYSQNRYKIAKLHELSKKIENDESLSQVSELEPLIEVVVKSVKEIAKDRDANKQDEILNKQCQQYTGLELEQFIDKVIDDYIQPLEIAKVNEESTGKNKEGLVVTTEEVNNSKETDNSEFELVKSTATGLRDKTRLSPDLEPITGVEFDVLTQQELIKKAYEGKERQKAIYEADETEKGAMINYEVYDEIINEFESGEWVNVYRYGVIKDELKELKNDLVYGRVGFAEARATIEDYFEHSKLIPKVLDEMADHKRMQMAPDELPPVSKEEAIKAILEYNAQLQASQKRELTKDALNKSLNYIINESLNREKMDLSAHGDAGFRVKELDLDGDIQRVWYPATDELVAKYEDLKGTYNKIIELYNSDETTTIKDKAEFDVALTEEEMATYKLIKLKERWNDIFDAELEKRKDKDSLTADKYDTIQEQFVLYNRIRIVNEVEKLLYNLENDKFKPVEKVQELSKTPSDGLRAVEGPKVEETKVEETKVVETKVEEPEVEEPEVEEVKTEEPKNEGNNVETESKVVETENIVEEPVKVDGSENNKGFEPVDVTIYSEKGNRIKSIKASIKRVIMGIIDEKIENINTEFNDKKLKTYYSYYIKGFKSIKKMYDFKSSNTVLSGISQEVADGVKSTIDAYFEKNILTKIKNDKEFESLSNADLIARYLNYEELKDFVITTIENNANALISNSYSIDIENPLKNFKNGSASTIVVDNDNQANNGKEDLEK